VHLFVCLCVKFVETIWQQRPVMFSSSYKNSQTLTLGLYFAVCQPTMLIYYIVLVETLNPAQSISQSISQSINQ